MGHPDGNGPENHRRETETMDHPDGTEAVSGGGRG